MRPTEKPILKTLGIVFAFLAVFLNPIILGKILLNRAIENMAIVGIIVAFEITIVALGIFLFLKTDFFIQKHKEIALFLVVSIVSLFALEIFAKLVWQTPMGGWYGYPPGLYEPHEKMGYIFKPNFKGYFPNPPFQNIAIEINSKGLRDIEHEYQKREGTTRILGLGDSITFGSGVEFEDTYLRVLEKKLNKNGHPVEIIKTGVNSYEFDHEYAYYTNEGYKYESDIVILGLFLNDISEITPELIEKQKKEIEDLQKKEAQGIYLENPSLWDRIKTVCTLCDIAHTTIYRASKKNEREYYNLAYFNSALKKRWTTQWPKFQNKILKLNSELSKKGVKFVIVVFPQTEQFSHSYGLTQFPQEKLKEMGKTYNIPVFDLLPYLDKPEYKTLYLVGDGIHPNKAGHALVADILFEELLKSGIIK